MCIILGDSIAVGIASILHSCVAIARVGVSSGWIAVHAIPTNFAIISAGSNDPYNPNLRGNLVRIAERVHGQSIWIAPINPHARTIVCSVGPCITFTPARDNIHPKSYRALVMTISREISQRD